MPATHAAPRLILLALACHLCAPAGAAAAAAAPAAAPGAAPGAAPHHAVFRVVRAEAGDPDRPEIVLPAGYEFLPGGRYHVASRAEYYTFVRGPRSEHGIPVTVRWPGVAIDAVVASNRRLPLERVARGLGGDGGDAVRFRLPVVAPTPDADQATIQVWSHMPTAPGIQWRIEHNDPDRAAGPWAEVPWPAPQARAVIHWLAAAEAILRDSGLAAAAAGRGHFFALMGFETNNTLHPDNPPHWHLSYYAGDTYRAPAHIPHFWLDTAGAVFYNGMDVTGQGRQRLRAGDAGRILDPDGALVVTVTIRADGGLDVAPPAGAAYAILPGRDGAFVAGVAVHRAGRPWLSVWTDDDVRAGRLAIRVRDAADPAGSREAVYRYDPLTGVLAVTAAPPPAPAPPGRRTPARSRSSGPR
jgi:hypothetical protein